MRVLVGHSFSCPELQQNIPLPAREASDDEIVSFGFAYPQFPYHKGMTFDEILARCPQGWKPEVYIHWSPEYNPIPIGIEKAGCLTVGVFGDWNLGGQTIHTMGGAFDLLVADRGGCELLRNAGFTEVIHGLLWAQDPALHRILPTCERDVDILMIGNFNHAVQQERALWLARVARLTERHNVVLTSGLYGEDYVRMMNRAKIVFNRSIRGELNMRAYEAPACGAMLFYERGNAEVDCVFQDRKHCVLYGDDNLEELLDYYLAPENQAERERITQNGTKEVQAHSYSHHFADVLNKIEEHLHSRTTPRKRAYSARQHAIHWLTCYEPNLAHNLHALLNRAQSEAQSPIDQSIIASIEGSSRAVAGQIVSSSTEKSRLWNEAIPQFQRAIQLHPENTLAHANLGMLLLMGGTEEMGIYYTEESIRQLQSKSPDAIVGDGILFPRLYDYSLVAMERVHGKHLPDSVEWRNAFVPLLISRLSLALAERAYHRADYQKAVEWASLAVEHAPENSAAYYQMARALRASGFVNKAVDFYKKQILFAPFDMQGWEELAQLYCDLSYPHEAATLLDELISILKGSPFYADQCLKAKRLRQQAVVQMRQGSGVAGLECFLAFPDWNSPSEWQEIVRLFTLRYRPNDPVVLMLRADPLLYPDTQTLLATLQNYLLEDLRLRTHALPRITLLNQPMNSDDLWKVMFIAQACFITPTLPPLCKELVENLQKPLLTVEEWRGACTS